MLIAVLVAAVVPVAPASAATVTVGVVGCSNTKNAVEGYHEVSSEDRLWDLADISNYGGKDLTMWADPDNPAWLTFAAALERHPETSSIWWELCVRGGAGDTEATVDAIVENILALAPGVTIYASPLDDTPTCTLGDPERSEGYVDYLVAKGSAERGPTMTPLSSDETDDGCHANEAGKLVWGQDLVDFFDGDGPPPPDNGGAIFLDVPTDHTFYADIEWLAAEGITKGCNPPDNDLFCPDDPVTRGQMAAFLVRALGLPASAFDYFDDDETSVFEGDINALRQADITFGCNPPANDLFCPEDPVSRAQMAAFLVRAYGLVDGAGANLFEDDDGSVFEADIDILGTAGVTKGCNPPDNDLYCPDDPVTRAEMAAFLHRAAAL